MRFQLLGVQVGAVQPLKVGEQRVMSGIRKRAVHGPVAVRVLGLVAGPRDTPLMTLFGSVRAKHA